jgi:hypothetical protein
MIPTVYDSERVLRILGSDFMEQIVTVNQENPDGDLINDLKKGRYDVTVTIGPNFQTQRQETLQTLLEAAESIPLVAQYCPDLLAKNLDSPDAHEMARRLRIPLIQQGIVKPTEGENVAPQKPDPMKEMAMQLTHAKLMKMSADAQVATSRAGASHLEGERLMYETAGKHLANMLAAKKLGEPSAAEEAESTAQSAYTPTPQSA